MGILGGSHTCPGPWSTDTGSSREMCSASISAVCLHSAVHLTPTIDFTHPYLREIRRNLEHNELDFFSRSVSDNAASRNSVTAVAREMQRKGAEAIGAFFSPQPRAE